MRAPVDRERGKLWVTVTGRDEVVQLTADGAPRVKRRFPTVRRPNAIAVDEATGRSRCGAPAASCRVRWLPRLTGRMNPFWFWVQALIVLFVLAGIVIAITKLV